MTRTVRPPDAVVRNATVYGVVTRTVRAPYGTELGYVGQTARDPYVRLGEHEETQPFGDLIVGVMVLWSSTDVRQAVLDAMEQAYIKQGYAGRRPRYNIEHNMDNADRIPPWTAIAQRQAREPGWTPATRPVRTRSKPAARVRVSGSGALILCALLLAAAFCLAVM